MSTVDCCNSFWYSLLGAACLPRPIVIQVWHNYSYMTLIPLSTFLWMLGELLSSLHNIIIHDDIKNICVHVDAQNAQISPQSQSNYYKGIAYYSQASGKIFSCYMGLFIFCIMSWSCHFWIFCFILNSVHDFSHHLIHCYESWSCARGWQFPQCVQRPSVVSWN